MNKKQTKPERILFRSSGFFILKILTGKAQSCNMISRRVSRVLSFMKRATRNTQHGTFKK